VTGEEAARRRVRDEWAPFLRKFLPEVERVAAKRVRILGLEPVQGKDLVQETTVVLFSKWQELALIVDDEHRRRFVYRVLHYVVLAQVRSKKRSVVQVPLNADELVAADARRIADVADQYLDQALGRAYQEALQQLCGEEKLVIEAMLDVEPGRRRRTHREIAERLDIPERRVGHLIHSAQGQLLTFMNALGYQLSDVFEIKEGAR
jgi:RNA polymerase sigma factor (sigma-70 family)